MKPFEEFVDRRGPNACWPWTGRRRGGVRNQYGAYGNKQAHRLALEISLGRELDKAEIACHICDNPICCNPRHLYAGSRKDNAQDAVSRGRIKPADQRGERNGNAKLSNEDVLRIRGMIDRGKTNVAIAKHFNVSHSMISKIRTGNGWRSRQDSNL